MYEFRFIKKMKDISYCKCNILNYVSVQGNNSAGRPGWRGHWAVYFTSLQSFIITFSYSLA